MTTSQAPIFRLDCKAQSYDWGKVGSESSVAQFAASSPSFVVDENRPYAELWMGTHRNAPSTVFGSDRSLESVLQTHPQLITPHFHQKYQGHLPFLFKVLSIGKALSIQAHPDKELAEKLFKSRPDLYKDDNHKPEMAIALTEFEALCGFKPLDEISAALDQWPELWALVGDKEAKDFQDAVKRSEQVEGIKGIKEGRLALKTLFRTMMTADALKVKKELDRMMERLNSVHPSSYEAHSPEAVILRIHSQFPGDVGVFCFFFLNYIVLAPGQAIFLAADEPHAYLSGDCVECMAASDNVVRAGLTPKFKDVDVLTEMLTYQTKSSTDQLLSGVLCTPTGHSLMYDPPIEEFSVILTKLDHPKEKERLRGAEGPSVVIVTAGQGVIRTEKHHDSDPEVIEIAANTGNVFFIGANTPFSIEAVAEEGVTIYTAFSVRADKKDHYHH
ncbi:mannose-6-phosphate isomerase [Entomortierella parvispora]|uniref:Mannose-6-phosphate isomerase n=1 Tax=Entomortierella parvispora TaxID=205924 RepID=A0A9P3HB69_9FUNG|nr:mannose-6-phosphate isomerase [Entomortierella parvispora]